MSTSPPGTYPETAATIRAQCDRLGINQSELARRVGVAPGTVYRWSTGATRPDLRTILAIKAMRKRVEVNANDLETVVEWINGQPIPTKVYNALKRLRAATTKTQPEPITPD